MAGHGSARITRAKQKGCKNTRFEPAQLRPSRTPTFCELQRRRKQHVPIICIFLVDGSGVLSRFKCVQGVVAMRKDGRVQKGHVRMSEFHPKHMQMRRSNVT